MPTYEYRCPKGHEFELFQRMSDKPRAKCPTCNAAAVRRISGGAGLHFKGSGFYITDYRSDHYKEQAKTEKPAADSGAKPAEKPAPKSGDTAAKSKKKKKGD